MKNKILLSLIAIMIAVTSFAQIPRGNYGDYLATQPFSATNYFTGPGSVYTPTVSTTVPAGDTMWAQWTYHSNYNHGFTAIVDTAGANINMALILEATNDGISWYTLTGLTNICTTCIGASKAVTNVTKRTTYTWQVPGSQPVETIYRLRGINTGTTTATFSGIDYANY